MKFTLFLIFALVVAISVLADAVHAKCFKEGEAVIVVFFIFICHKKIYSLC